MEKDFRLTSSEYAKVRGLSVEALRSRRRRELESGNFICVQGKYWWKNDRPFMVKTNGKDRLVPGPGAVSYGPRKRNRGALARGEKPDYANWQMEEHNRVLALAKIRDDLGDEVCDEIAPEMFKIAKERVAKRKRDEAEKTLEITANRGLGIPVGVDLTPPQYGTMLNAQGIQRQIDTYHRLKDYQWNYKTDVKFINEPGKKYVPDFSSSSSTKFGNFRGYEMNPIDDGAIYIEDRDIPADDQNPEFKNKIEESIYRLKRNK